ncbi:DUF1802 family protein [Luteolibacter algae]|uniref:DUF1802 family protein n=1 Tax=Luteolibacter algae TaxID=454151 RepID=A0ABW5D853_9BACT
MSIAFKEWRVVCDALSTGRQTILLRKGGIHEGREGFAFAHDRFFLFPTKFHAQLDQVREGEFTPEREWQVGDVFEITHFAKAEYAVTLTDWNQVEDLFPYHIYTEQTLKERFDWEGKGMSTGSIHLALVRVYALGEPLELHYEKKFGGCRSWVEIPAEEGPTLSDAVPVVKADAFAEIAAEISMIAGRDFRMS